MPTRFRLTSPLYLRIWLAVVLAVVVLTLAFGALWRWNTQDLPTREVLLRNEAGQIIGQGRSRPVRVPGQGVEFPVQLHTGDTVYVQLPPRQRHGGTGPPPRPWFSGPDGSLWLLSLVAVAVAVGTYPIVRRLTQRLETLQAHVQRWGSGQLSTRVTLSGHDEVAQLAQQFNKAADRIEALVAANRSLLANASHELRSPLARIRMGLELMSGGSPGPLRDEMTRSIGELDQLIDEILLASRLDAHEADMGTEEDIDLAGLLAEECARVDAGLDVTPMDAPLVVKGVNKLLRRAVRNLLENARRHGGGPIDVCLGRRPAGLELRVCDRGPGVPTPYRERIFEPFFRLPGASETDGGVGLGLALVKSIAERHGAQVRCEPRDGGGACFVLTWPSARRN